MRELSDDEIIAVRKATPLTPLDYSRPWGDTLAFARAILAAAQSGPPREPTREVGWLIEAVAGGRYWCGGSCGWTPSPNLACRFARAADANAAREWLRLPPVDIRVVEHLWIDVAPQPDHAGTAGPPDHQPDMTREQSAPQASTEPGAGVMYDRTPVAYRYLFTDPITGAPVWRHESQTWNGQRPE